MKYTSEEIQNMFKITKGKEIKMTLERLEEIHKPIKDVLRLKTVKQLKELITNSFFTEDENESLMNRLSLQILEEQIGEIESDKFFNTFFE